jgi:GSH-dependent disulfide-bond oxidoreductase
MYELYAERSPNVYKVAVALEELGLPWREVWVDVGRGAQHEAGFLAISPNGRVPVLVDHEPADRAEALAVWESGNILLYLAEKHGRFLPAAGRARNEVLTWVFWQMAGLGPMAGQNAHVLQYQPAGSDYATTRYHTEVERLYRVLDRQLAGREFIAGDYSIADMACFPWVRMHKVLLHEIEGLSNLSAWRARMAARPAVAEAYRRMDALPRSEASKAERFEAMSPNRGLAVAAG